MNNIVIHNLRTICYYKIITSDEKHLFSYCKCYYLFKKNSFGVKILPCSVNMIGLLWTAYSMQLNAIMVKIIVSENTLEQN